MRLGRAFRWAMVVLGFIALAGCSSDAASDGASATSTSAPSSTSAAVGAAQNACPVAGCSITVVDAQREGQELRLTWDANFAPDFSKNHIHVFWDTYTASQVSDDAAGRGETQGEWVPTGDYPEFVTEGAVSTSARGSSTRLCVTAGDRDHIVIDASIVDCRDVSDLL